MTKIDLSYRQAAAIIYVLRELGNPNGDQNLFTKAYISISERTKIPAEELEESLLEGLEKLKWIVDQNKKAKQRVN